MFIHITLAGRKFSSGTLPTMHSIYSYTDIYQGLIQHFWQTAVHIYIYIYKLTLEVKQIFTVVKKLKQLQIKPRENSEAPTGFEPIDMTFII